MSAPHVLESLDLAALLCSRVCHDLISPVGAIMNGLEVMEESKDEETKTFAMDLIKKSSRTASAKLQFCRLAFGAAGSVGAQIDTGDAEKVARGMLEDEKTKIAWSVPRVLLPKNRVKLLLNMLLVAVQAIPRGGELAVSATGEGERMGFRIAASGTNIRVPQAAVGLLAGQPAEGHRSTPMPSSLSIPACWPATAVLTVNVAAEGEAIVVAAL